MVWTPQPGCKVAETLVLKVRVHAFPSDGDAMLAVDVVDMFDVFFCLCGLKLGVAGNFNMMGTRCGS